MPKTEDEFYKLLHEPERKRKLIQKIKEKFSSRAEFIDYLKWEILSLPNEELADLFYWIAIEVQERLAGVKEVDN